MFNSNLFSIQIITTQSSIGHSHNTIINTKMEEDMNKTSKKKDGDQLEEASLKDPTKSQKAVRRCTYCDKLMSSKNLSQHIKKVHLKLDHEKCPDCGKSFDKRYLKMHREAVHLKKRTECKDCGMSLKINNLGHRHRCKGKLEEDMNTLSIEDTDKLEEASLKDPPPAQEAGQTARFEYCDKAFSSQNLKNHIKAVHLKLDEIKKCHDCGKSFKKKYFHIHCEAVHLKKQTECQGCGKSFKINYIYHHRKKCVKYKELKVKCHQKHISTAHSGQSVYVQCDLCPKRIVRKRLKRHQAFHRRVFIKALCV